MKRGYFVALFILISVILLYSGTLNATITGEATGGKKGCTTGGGGSSGTGGGSCAISESSIHSDFKYPDGTPTGWDLKLDSNRLIVEIPTLSSVGPSVKVDKKILDI